MDDDEDMMEEMVAMMMMGEMMSMGLDDDELEDGFGFGMKMPPGMPPMPGMPGMPKGKNKKGK